MVLIGCLIIVGTLVGAALLWVKLGNLRRAIDNENEESVER